MEEFVTPSMLVRPPSAHIADESESGLAPTGEVQPSRPGTTSPAS
ncbi:hypothetical protein NSERUTF1_1171 [Nocardia seriolae]|nr:hypothetical protein NSERUTF1_1171 [Nocardia seriolae]